MEEGFLMNQDWPTKNQDILMAKQILETYAEKVKTESLGIFELVVDQKAKRMDYQLAQWVQYIASHFKLTYGQEKGDFITGQVISYWLTEGQTIH